MESLKIQIPNSAIGSRVDQWISKNTEYSRSQFKHFVENKCVRFNGELVTKAGFKITRLGILEINKTDIEFEAIPMPLDIVYEDEYLLIVNKPRNMLVYPVKNINEPTLVNGLMAYTMLSNYCGNNRPGLVHRIDRDTSGLVLVAKNNEVHEKLYKILANHDIVREYIGIVCNPFDIKEGVINKRIAQDFAHGTKRITVQEGGQEAITHYKCVYQNNEYALVRFQLETGRTHQIRVHMASDGHPMVGDGLYGVAKNVFGFQGQALHAVRLSFIHPITNEKIVAYGKPPEIFKKAVKRIRMME